MDASISPPNSAIELGHDIETGNLVTLQQDKRLGGMYVIGKTGSGKTTLLVNMILQDIEQGMGLCFIDVHGDAITDILKRLPAHRENDVILLNPLDKDYAFGLNLFECDATDEEQVSRTVSYVLEVFAKLFTKSGVFDSEAVNMELTLRNAAYALIDNLSMYGTTMAEIPLLIDDEEARIKLMDNITNVHSEAKRFWNRYHRWKMADQFTMAGSTARAVNKFLSNMFIRQVVGQSISTLDFRNIMDEGKILLVKLSRRDRELTNLVGSIIVGQIANAAFSREDTPIHERVQFNLYADEYERFSTPTFAELLAEVRKYKIATCVAHQWRQQLDMDNREATLNAANLVVFQVSGEDATELAQQFEHGQIPGEPQINYKRMISPTPIDDLILGKPHTSDVVNNAFRNWREVVSTAHSQITEREIPGKSSWSPRYGSSTIPPKTVSNRDEVELAQGRVDLLNEFLCEIMREKNPYEMVLPHLLLRLAEQDGYTLVENKNLFYMDENTKSLTGKPFDYPHLRHQPRDYFYQMVQLKRDVQEGESSVILPSDAWVEAYVFLWIAKDEAALTQAFSRYEQLVVDDLREGFEKRAIGWLRNKQWTRFTYIGEMENMERGRKHHGNPHYDFIEMDIEELGLSTLTAHDLTFHWEERKDAVMHFYYLEKNERGEEVQHHPWVYLLDDTEENALAIQAAIEHELKIVVPLVLAQKPRFEAYIRHWREVFKILANEPVETFSSVIEEKHTRIPPHEVVGEIANSLANPKKKYTARCKLADGSEHTIAIDETEAFRPAGASSVVLSRNAGIVTQTQRNFCKRRNEVEQEIAARQETLTRPDKKPPKSKQDD